MIATTEEQLLPVGQSFHDVPWKKPAKIIKEGFENPVGRLKSVYVLLGIKRGLEIKGPVIKQAAVQFNVPVFGLEIVSVWLAGLAPPAVPEKLNKLEERDRKGGADVPEGT